MHITQLIHLLWLAYTTQHYAVIVCIYHSEVPVAYGTQWRIQAGAHPARAPSISPNDFTDPARSRPLFHRLFTKSCASITIDLITSGSADKMCLNFT